MVCLCGAFGMWLGLCEGAWGTVRAESEGQRVGQVALGKSVFFVSLSLSRPVFQLVTSCFPLCFFRHG